MNLVALNNIFDIKYGNQFDLSKMSLSENVGEGINFISRASKNFGIVAKVQPSITHAPFPSGLITVTLGGSYLLASFVQPDKFYTAQNIKVLSPKKEMSTAEKIFYCLCIQENRFRYSSHGREANVSLDSLLVPEKVPHVFASQSLDKIKKNLSLPLTKKSFLLNPPKWNYFKLSYLFEIKKGKRLTSQNFIVGNTPFVGATDSNNGWSNYIGQPAIFKGNVITVNYDGNGVAESFYQPVPFWALDSVNVLYPKFDMNKYIGLFICALLKKEKYRFNYGRKWNLERMNESQIKLPVDSNGKPDFEFMENYIKSLPYSSSI